MPGPLTHLVSTKNKLISYLSRSVIEPSTRYDGKLDTNLFFTKKVHSQQLAQATLGNQYRSKKYPNATKYEGTLGIRSR